MTILVLLGCIIVLIAADVALIIQNRSLKQKLAECYKQGPGQIRQIGDPSPEIDVYFVRAGHYVNEKVRVNRGVLFIFSADCMFCRDSAPILQAVQAAKGIQVVAVCVDFYATAKRWKQDNGVEFSVVSAINPKGVLDSLANGAVPVTYVIDGGKIKSVWQGELTSPFITQIGDIL